MITTIDNGAFWSWSDAQTIWFENGVKRQIETSDVIFTHGKFDGYKLSEVTDTWYLRFIKEKNSDDYFIKTLFEKRLGELT